MHTQLNSKNKKAQTSIELLVLIGIAFVALLVFSALARDRLLSVHKQTEQTALEQIAGILHNEVLLAATVSNGYMRAFTLPTGIDGKNYTIEIIKNNTIFAKSGKFESSQVTFNVTGQPLLGENTIKKENDVISLNQE